MIYFVHALIGLYFCSICSIWIYVLCRWFPPNVRTRTHFWQIQLYHGAYYEFNLSKWYALMVCCLQSGGVFSGLEWCIPHCTVSTRKHQVEYQQNTNQQFKSSAMGERNTCSNHVAFSFFFFVFCTCKRSQSKREGHEHDFFCAIDGGHNFTWPTVTITCKHGITFSPFWAFQLKTPNDPVLTHNLNEQNLL